MRQTTYITLNLQTPNYATVYAARDNLLSRYVSATLLDGAAPWTPPAGTYAEISYIKSDGTGGYYDTAEDGSLAYAITNNVVEFVLAQQALTVPGDVRMALDFFNVDGDSLSTFTFVLTVPENSFPYAQLASGNYFNVMQATLAEMAQYIKTIQNGYGAPLVASTVAAMTDHTHVYVYTGSESGYTSGNWYYWDGSAWVSGGVYNSTAFTTDKTLTISGAAADAKVAGALMASQYSSAATYDAGAYVLYDGKLYKSNTKIETPEAWNDNHWGEVRANSQIRLLQFGHDRLASGGLNRIGFGELRSSFSRGALNATTGAYVSGNKSIRTIFMQNYPFLVAAINGSYRIFYYNTTEISSFAAAEPERVCYKGQILPVTNQEYPYIRVVFYKYKLNTSSDFTDEEVAEANLSFGVLTWEAKTTDRAQLTDALKAVYSHQLNANTSIYLGQNITSNGALDRSAPKYARKGSLTIPSTILFEIPEGYAAKAYWYTATTTPETQYFVSSQNIRVSGVFLLTPPENAVGLALVFNALDLHDLTQEDAQILADATQYVYKKNASLNESSAYPSAEAKAAFVDYMAQMCAKLGMASTTFANASGLTRDSVTTPADELKMALAVAGNPKALDIWSTRDRSFDIGGENARTIPVTNNVYGAEPAGAYYKVLGGKGGSILASASEGTNYRKARVAIYEINETPVLVSMSSPSTDRAFYDAFTSYAQDVCRLEDATMRELAVGTINVNSANFRSAPATDSEILRRLASGDMLIILEVGETWTKAEIDGVVGYVSANFITSGYSGGHLGTILANGGGFCAVPCPTLAGSYLNSESVTELLGRKNAIYAGENLSQIPASTTKTMTMLCALSVADDLQEIITLNSTDVSTGGSGSVYYSGDKLTLEDALRIMMMESSNILAEAIGRVIGIKILQTAEWRDN